MRFANKGVHAEWRLPRGFWLAIPCDASERSKRAGFIEDRYFRADGFIIRTKITIRTDGFSSVQGLVTLPRANRVFCTDERHPYKKHGF